MYDESRFCGEGARRRVYSFGEGNVMKVPKSEYGVKSNKREVRLYRTSPFRLRRHLGKIRKYGRGYKWVVMKKYSRHFPISRRYARKLRRLRRLFKRNGILPYEVVSRLGKPNYQNLRINRRGTIIVIDYGNFVRTRKRKWRRR
jgi:hypothetical protein